jgi:hypothetical protein
MLRTSIAALGASLALATAAQAGVFVAANKSGTTDLGLFAAGDWLITGSGVADFTGSVGQLQFNPDGTLTRPPSGAYASFPMAGSPIADGLYGAGGTQIKLGALMARSSPAARSATSRRPRLRPTARTSLSAIRRS